MSISSIPAASRQMRIAPVASWFESSCAKSLTPACHHRLLRRAGPRYNAGQLGSRVVIVVCRYAVRQRQRGSAPACVVAEQDIRRTLTDRRQTAIVVECVIDGGWPAHGHRLPPAIQIVKVLGPPSPAEGRLREQMIEPIIAAGNRADCGSAIPVTPCNCIECEVTVLPSLTALPSAGSTHRTKWSSPAPCGP